MITTKDQAKSRDRCNSRFPFSRLDVQCQRDEGHESECLGGRESAFVGGKGTRYTWTASLLPVTI